MKSKTRTFETTILYHKTRERGGLVHEEGGIGEGGMKSRMRRKE